MEVLLFAAYYIPFDCIAFLTYPLKGANFGTNKFNTKHVAALSKTGELFSFQETSLDIA
jgi:hypothetical protein